MSPWHETQQPKWPVYGGIACVAGAMVVGLLLMMGAFSGDGDDGDRQPARPAGTTSAEPAESAEPAGPGSASPDSEAPPAAGPEVVSWGQQGRQLAVVVRNDSDQVIEQARVRITGLDAAGRSVVAATGSAHHVCCTVLGLTPGGEYGLYAPLRPGAGEIAEVSVEYVSDDSRAVASPEAMVKVTDARLKKYDDDTVVTATLTASGPVGKYVAVQALLVDTDGQVAQVISGRFWCYQPGTQRQIRLELFHAVPKGFRLDKVVAQSVPAGVHLDVKQRC